MSSSYSHWYHFIIDFIVSQIWTRCDNRIGTMRKDLWSILSMVNFTTLLLSFITTSVFAQGSPYSEEYMDKHDGGDRAEYLQEMEYSDPLFYVPPANNASFPNSTISNTIR